MPGHPLVYEKRVASIDPAAQSGDLVAALGRDGELVGYGFVHRTSVVAFRLLERGGRNLPEGEWLVERLAEAERVRRDVLRLPEATNAWRVVHAEGDGLSGLIVDRYGDVAVAGLYSLGWARRAEWLRSSIAKALGVAHVVLRVDARSAEQEGIGELDGPGSAPLVQVREHGLEFTVDPAGGHKTGFFLDQRDNRRFVGSLAAGRRVFDGMTYTGGFALAAAHGGATSVEAMDLDEEALVVAERNAARNRLSVRFQHGDVFEGLRARARLAPAERPNLIVLDPPKWAKSRSALDAAHARYRDLNRLGFAALAPGGLLVTHTCSGLMTEDRFLDMLREAAREAVVEARIVRVAGAAADHPVDLRVPEGRYLSSVALVRS